MILEFGVGGFLSFKETQYFYLTPPVGSRIKGTKYENNFCLDIENRPMKSAILFGDNASGKTNWFFALKRLQSIIKNGLGEVDLDLLNKDSDKVDFSISVMDKKFNIFDFKIIYNKDGFILKEELKENNNLVYSYLNNKLILEKYKIKDKEVIEKIFSKASSNTILIKLKDILEEYNNSNIQSFIDTIGAIKIKTDEFFNDDVKFFPIKYFTKKDKELLESFYNDVLMILQTLDQTITNFKFKENFTEYELILCRGNNTEFDLRGESFGVRKIINLLKYLIKINTGETIVIDELDSSIGAKSLIRLFNGFINSEKNKSGQIIISTHNLALLNLDMFNPSQLYIINKSKNDFSTNINSISDFEFRSNKKGIDELYVKGCFNIES